MAVPRIFMNLDCVGVSFQDLPRHNRSIDSTTPHPFTGLKQASEGVDGIAVSLHGTTMDPHMMSCRWIALSWVGRGL